MKTILLLHDESGSPKPRLQNVTIRRNTLRSCVSDGVQSVPQKGTRPLSKSNGKCTEVLGNHRRQAKQSRAEFGLSLNDQFQRVNDLDR
jgi:hypothetical protein